MENNSIIMWVLGSVVTLLYAYFWYDKNKLDKEVDRLRDDDISKAKDIVNLQKKVEEHSNKFITDQRSRDIAQSEIQPLKDDVNQMKSNLSSIMTSLGDLTTELKISNAIRDYEKSNNK